MSSYLTNRRTGKRFPVGRKLNVAERQRLANLGLALPDGSYPFDTPGRAHAALSYSSRFATPRERAWLCRMIAKRYPEIHAKSCPMHGGM